MILQDFWTCKRIAFTIYMQFVNILVVFGVLWLFGFNY